MNRRIARGSSGREFVLRPPVRAHIAHPVKMTSLFNTHRRAMDISDQNTGLLYFHLLQRGDRPLHSATDHNRSGGNNTFDDGALTDDHRTTGMHFAFHLTVDPNRPVETDNAFKTCSLAEKGKFVI